MSNPQLLSSELSAQTPPEVLALLETVQEENATLKADKTRLETLVAQLQNRIGAAAAVPSNNSLAYGRRSRRGIFRSRSSKRILRIVFLLGLTLVGAALLTWSVKQMVGKTVEKAMPTGENR